MSEFFKVVGGIIAILASPFLVYFLVKFGRYGYLKANQLFADQQTNKNP